MTAVAQPVRRLTDEERADVVERVLAGETQKAVAASFGISRGTVQNVLRAHWRAGAAADLDAAALRFRYRVGLELAERATDAEERASLLASVVWPSRKLLEASRARALGRAGGPSARVCKGCGGQLADYTEGCATCVDRRLGRAKRERQRAAARERGEAAESAA